MKKRRYFVTFSAIYDEGFTVNANNREEAKEKAFDLLRKKQIKRSDFNEKAIPVAPIKHNPLLDKA